MVRATHDVAPTAGPGRDVIGRARGVEQDQAGGEDCGRDVAARRIGDEEQHHEADRREEGGHQMQRAAQERRRRLGDVSPSIRTEVRRRQVIGGRAHGCRRQTCPDRDVAADARGKSETME